MSKTRLAVGVGATRSAAFAKAFLQDTVDAIRRAGGTPILSTTEPKADFGLTEPIERFDQGGGNLGNRIERVVAEGLRRSGRVVVMGADSPGIPAQLLDRLLRFEGRGVVIPAEDGGFVALGLQELKPGLFDDVPWSAANTLDVLMQRASMLGLPIQRLDVWFDVDEVDDLERLRTSAQPVDCPNTWRVLQSLPSEST